MTDQRPKEERPKESRRSRSQARVRSQAREAVMKALFAVDVGRMHPRRALNYVLEEEKLPPGGLAFAQELMEGVMAHRQELDALIDEYAVGWRIERMATVDRNILRLALYEVLHREDIPHGATANEAVELAKRYGDEESPKFINGILGEVIRRLSAPVQPR